MNSFDAMDSDSTSPYHNDNAAYNDSFVWSQPDHDNGQYSDSDYNNESEMSSPLSQ